MNQFAKSTTKVGKNLVTKCMNTRTFCTNMKVVGHIPNMDRPCKTIPEIYETAHEKINLTSDEWKKFFHLSERPPPENQKRYLRDGIPMTFYDFEMKYGNFADSMWESASIHNPYYE
tara:strand:+ start:137 stop:487 length:351 start_codon:yes stop_codon:yes gene_type:complete